MHVTINEKIYPTHMAGFTECFVPNNLIRKITIEKEVKASDMVKLAELGAIDIMELLDWYASQGFAISHVMELSFFEDLEIKHFK